MVSPLRNHGVVDDHPLKMHRASWKIGARKGWIIEDWLVDRLVSTLRA